MTVKRSLSSDKNVFSRWRRSSGSMATLLASSPRITLILPGGAISGTVLKVQKK